MATKAATKPAAFAKKTASKPAKESKPKAAKPASGDAEWGYKKDGTPKAKPGQKPKAD